MSYKSSLYILLEFALGIQVNLYFLMTLNDDKKSHF